MAFLVAISKRGFSVELLTFLGVLLAAPERSRSTQSMAIQWLLYFYGVTLLLPPITIIINDTGWSPRSAIEVSIPWFVVKYSFSSRACFQILITTERRKAPCHFWQKETQRRRRSKSLWRPEREIESKCAIPYGLELNPVFRKSLVSSVVSGATIPIFYDAVSWRLFFRVEYRTLSFQDTNSCWRTEIVSKTW